MVDATSPYIESNVLLCDILDCQTKDLHAWSDRLLTTVQQDRFKRCVQQRLLGIPIAYITEICGFWSLDLKVTKDTLIPRADTELLVTLSLDYLQPDMIVADLGTGSGAIALALAREQPSIKVLAIDYSRSALQLAKINSLENQLYNIIFIQANWLAASKDAVFDLIISNPPYIVEDDPHLIEGDVRFEPSAALVSGKDGLTDIRVIVEQARFSLKANGWLLVEHGYHQANQVGEIFSFAGFINICSYQDYGGNDRAIMGQLSSH